MMLSTSPDWICVGVPAVPLTMRVAADPLASERLQVPPIQLLEVLNVPVFQVPSEPVAVNAAEVTVPAAPVPVIGKVDNTRVPLNPPFDEAPVIVTEPNVTATAPTFRTMILA